MHDERLQELVTPFYLQMVRVNALEMDDELLAGVAANGRTASVDEVLGLLQDSWRPRVMGAWYALFHDDPQIPEAVADCLRSSSGTLTSPPLAVSAVVLLGSEALGALEFHAEQDSSHVWGGHGFLAAALEHLGVTASTGRPEDRHRAEFDGLLAVARRLRPG